MPAGGAIALGAPCTEALTTVDYLVELRFTVVSFANPADWQLELESAEADAFGGRHCQLLRLAGSYADAPTTHVSWRGSGRGDVSQPAIAVSPGHTYVLQSWGEADPDSSTRRHHCRLLDTDGATELRHAVLDSDLSGAVGPGTISVRTSDVEILVDHIRAYRDPQ